MNIQEATLFKESRLARHGYSFKKVSIGEKKIILGVEKEITEEMFEMFIPKFVDDNNNLEDNQSFFSRVAQIFNILRLN